MKKEAPTEMEFRFCDELGPKSVLHLYQPSLGMKAIVVVDNVACGPAIGGTRTWGSGVVQRTPEGQLRVQELQVEVEPRYLDGPGLTQFCQHQEEDDGAETATDHVQERERKFFRRSPVAPGHQGQSLDGLRKEPLLTWASCQNSEAAMGSPSIGARITLIGTLRGSWASALR